MTGPTTVRNWVGGQWRDAADGRTTELVDPTTGQAYGTAPLSGRADVEQAVDRRGFQTRGHGVVLHGGVWHLEVAEQRQVAMVCVRQPDDERPIRSGARSPLLADLDERFSRQREQLHVADSD